LENERVESNRTTHEIEGIGLIRAQNGTALETIAGAASHWQGEALRLANLIDSEGKKKWNGGFLTGSVSTATILAIGLLLLRFLY
jgi:hypothetical protein